jgi:hypothetical protein
MKIGVSQSSAARIRRAVEAVEAGARQGIVTSELQQSTIDMSWVQITSTSQTDNRYPGSLYRRLGADASFEIIGSAGYIWVDTPNGESLSTSTYYPARISGVKESDSKPIFDVIASSKDAFIRGKLDGTLSYQGSATLSIWWYNGSAEADTTENVTVYDWLLSSGQTIASGKQVTAAWDSRSSRYYVTGAQCA